MDRKLPVKISDQGSETDDRATLADQHPARLRHAQKTPSATSTRRCRRVEVADSGWPGNSAGRRRVVRPGCNR
jgi:hypothetical protein